MTEAIKGLDLFGEFGVDLADHHAREQARLNVERKARVEHHVSEAPEQDSAPPSESWLVEKYRPARFADVVGQQAAVDLMTPLVNADRMQPILLEGPPGTGKTTLARIMAQAWTCELANPEPCRRCETCSIPTSGGQGHFQYLEVNASLHRSHADSASVAEKIRMVPWGRFTTFIDEVQGLTEAAADALLQRVERPPDNACVLLATSNLAAVRPALRARCKVVRVDPLPMADRVSYLRAICGKEAIRYDPDALEVLAFAVGGAPRDLLKTLDQAHALDGLVTADRIRSLLGLGWGPVLSDYVAALAAGDALGQEDALDRWGAAPQTKVDAIRDTLLFLYTRTIAPQISSNPVSAALMEISAEQRRMLVAPFDARARAAGITVKAYWLSLLDFWERRPPCADTTSLRVALHTFDDLVNPPGAPMPVVPTAELARRRRSRRIVAPSGKSASGQMESSFLTLDHARTLYEAATFLGQVHGAWFNAHLRLRHGPLGNGDEQAGSKLVSRLMHEHHVRLGSWGEIGLWAWMYVHQQTSEGLETEIVAHIPLASGARSLAWFRQRLDTLRPNQIPDAWGFDSPEVQRRHAPNSPAGRAKFHWKAMRHLWGGIDPGLQLISEDDRRIPLLDLLGVERALRRPAGPLKAIRRLEMSQNIGASSRKKEGDKLSLLSAFNSGDWEALQSGWEWLEHADRQSELQRIREAVDLAVAKWPGSDALQGKLRNSEIAAIQTEARGEPRGRLRSWQTWWSTAPSIAG